MKLSMNMNAPTPRKKILLVDDDPSILKVLSVVLEKSGYEVHTAHYSLPALFAVARTDPDLVLADLDMPIMDGFGLIRQLKGHRETAEIPVVAISGHDTPESRKTAQDAGCVAYLTKPIDARALPFQLAGYIKAHPH